MFLVAAVLFALTAMTYVEGASLHQDRGGSTVFARYAFNELVSFIAGWAILLDYVILIAVTAFSATQYLRVVLEPARQPRRGARAGAGVHRARRARQHPRLQRTPRAAGRRLLVAADLALQGFIVVLGLVAVLQPARAAVDPIHLGSAPDAGRTSSSR